MEKINIADLLRDCPKGMELDCTMFDNVTFVRVDYKREQFPIEIAVGGLRSKYLTKDGCFHDNTLIPEAKCVIFPKGKTTWEGFVPPCQFKDGDVVYIKTKAYNQNELIIIFKEIKNDHIHKHICFAYQVLYTGKNAVCHLTDVEIIRFATEEEKRLLFDTIKDNGYKWNAETKTLEKLPKFKVGDRITCVCNDWQYDIKELTNTHYTLVEVKDKFKYTVPIVEDKDWELVPNKFDITTLKPFDKVLVRNTNKDYWMISMFGYISKGDKQYFMCIAKSGFYQCIPYEQNKHLLGTTNDCDDFYKTWEK